MQIVDKRNVAHSKWYEHRIILAGELLINQRLWVAKQYTPNCNLNKPAL